MKILIADDNNTDRLILKRILTNCGYEVIAAVDGLEAVEFFNDSMPDLVLLDAMMPNMDGYEAAIEIKKATGDRLVPIIFLTSLQEASALAHCLEVGGDDFLTKPYNKIILEAKIKAFERMKLLHDEVREQRNEIQLYNDHMIHEQEVAKRLFDNIAHSGNLNQPNIKHLLSPMSIFNGDLLLVARTPSDMTHIMLGDFTGHGLPAAIGALPVADIFYGMTSKGFSIVDIVTEINKRLSNILPVGVFCCATICEINYRDDSIISWSGGLPDGYIARADEGIIDNIKSNHLPLGVLAPNNFSVETEMRQFSPNDKLYLFSDGLLEAEAPDGSMFGEERLKSVINSYEDASVNVYDDLLKAVADYTQSDKQTDDYTLIEYTIDDLNHNIDTAEDFSDEERQESMEWCFDYDFRPSTLRQFDPLPLVLQILNECSGLKDYRGRVFTVLAELFTNALDHGVLGLDSNMKKSAEGFAKFYLAKKDALDLLEDGFIKIRMEHLPDNESKGGALHIRIQNSGDGFDYSQLKAADNSFSGRGLALVQSLCKSMEYSDNGKQVDVIFDWDYS